MPLRVQTNKTLTTKGSTTSPEDKKCPQFLRPWKAFPELHTHYFDQAYRALCGDGTTPPPKIFTPRLALDRIGADACKKPLGSEKDLEHYDKTAVEDRTREIIDRLIIMADETRDLLNGCSSMEFENHLNSLTENEEDEKGWSQSKSKVDQACIFCDIRGQRRLCFVREFKAPHKLTAKYLRAGLRPIDVQKEVVQRVTIPTDPDKKLKYFADKLVASVVTQTYEYMIDNGLEYSSIVTGEAEVFLWVSADQPDTVHYYLTEPRLDAVGSGEYQFRIPFTAISRLLGFTLMALQSRPRDQVWCDNAAAAAGRWTVDVDDILAQMSDGELQESPPDSNYSSPEFPISRRSPYLLRPRHRRPLIDEPSPSSDRSDDHSADDPAPPDTPTPMGPRSDRTSQRKRDSDHDNTGSGPGPGSPQTRSCCAYTGAEYAYCTMKCLLGVKHGRALDPACPNYQHHQQGRQNEGRHELDATTLACQLEEQLERCRDHYCKPLFIPGERHLVRLQGAHGAMFKVTLARYGYTFVAKGTIEGFIHHLLRESKMYKYLVHVQGSATPVHLGNIVLRRPYREPGQKIVHMLLLAWGGDALDEGPPSSLSADQLEQEKQRSIRDIEKFQIIHNDLEPRNMLWNKELGRVLIIDLEGCRKAKREYAGIPYGLEQPMSVKRQMPKQTLLRQALSRSTDGRVHKLVEMS
ncbi:hypothetical protein DV735_g754, partial [Chaetothyriales sp. CBS 134920]